MCIFIIKYIIIIIVVVFPFLQGNSFKIEISFYEIYNEKIHDLLASTNKKNRSHVSYGCSGR